MHTDTTTTLPPTHLDGRWADTLDRLRAFVAARVEDRELAADITQDVIVRSIASGALERVDDPVAWLYRSAPNDATRELSRCLQPLVDQMAPAAREALMRVDVDGQTQQRAARDLGVSVSG